MTLDDWLRLIHPILSVLFILPLIGTVVNFAWETRQRRLQRSAGKTNRKLRVRAGRNHLKIGKWLSASVVGTILVAFAYSILYDHIIQNQRWHQESFEVIFIILIFLFTILSMAFLYRATSKKWRGIFATLTGMGLIILCSQPGVSPNTDNWYISHCYYGMVLGLLMIFSVATIEDIYRDTSLRWRKLHTTFNAIALLLLIGSVITGIRNLFQLG